MASTHLRGLPCKMYFYSWGDVPSTLPYNRETMQHIINNVSPINYYLAIPEVNNTQWNALTNDMYLYNAPEGEGLPSNLNVVTVNLWDSNLPDWQLQSILLSAPSGYNGTVNMVECASLFPNRFDITSYIEDSNIRGLCIYFPDVNYAWDCHRANSYTDSVFSNDPRLYDLESNSTVQTSLIPMICFDRSGRACKTVLTAYRTGEKRFGQYNTLGSGWPTMGNTVLYGNKGGGNTLPEYFFRSMEPGYIPPAPATDPFAPGGNTDEDGGNGPFGPNGEDITDPELPDVDAVSTGFITLFNPTVSQLNSLASYMWSGGFDVDTFKKIFANPMDCILGLSILPKIVPAGGSANILVGNIDTGVSMTKAAKQYVKFDCGSINISRYSNSFLDYSPYTKIYLYLPFIGIREISTDDVMNKSVQVKYSIDILSGACVAFVIAGGTTLYSYIGQCAASVPITGSDWSTMINGVLGAVGSIASTVGSFMTGNIAGGISGIASTAQNVLSSKPDIQHSGSMGGMGGMLGIKTPYVIIERPAQAIPARQNEYIGYPSFITKVFADLRGYNEIYATHLHDIPCTENELQEIESLLKSGVIF